MAGSHQDQQDPWGGLSPKTGAQTLPVRMGVSPGASGTCPRPSASSCASSLWKTTEKREFGHGSGAQKQRDMGRFQESWAYLGRPVVFKSRGRVPTAFGRQRFLLQLLKLHPERRH